MNRKSFPALVSILLACLASTAYADGLPLMGSGDHLPNTPLGEPPNVVREVFDNNSPVDFIAGWTELSGALPDWLGTYHGTGPLPAGTGNPAGKATYDFADLALAYLPVETMFRFGDVDNGSQTNETFTLNAWDLSGFPITTAWLDGPIGVWAPGGGGNPTLEQMPGWAFLNGEYFIDGTTVAGNPSVAFMLQSNVSIGTLSVDRNSSFANFSLAAPIPEPSTGLLALLGVSALPVMRRRRHGLLR